MMGIKHMVELLVETNKELSQIIDHAEHETSLDTHKQVWIDSLNTVIRRLDHIVEDLEKN